MSIPSVAGKSRTRLGWALLWLLLGVLVLLLVPILQRPIALPLYDYVEYWSAGRLGVMGRNPYSPDELLELQKQVGWGESRPLMMWNPPWTLTLVMPFGCLDFAQGHIVWLLCLVALLAFCTHRLCQIFQKDDRRLWIAAIVGVTFMPVIVTLTMSQITPIALLGFVGFLHFVTANRRLEANEERANAFRSPILLNDFLAGASAALVAVKPHLAHLFWIGLLLWSAHKRRWAVPAGVVTGLACLSTPPLLINPAVFVQYIDAMRRHPPQNWVMPTVGTLLRQWLGWEHFWLQFVPPLIGGMWFVGYWWLNHRDWSWPSRLPLVVIVSFLTSPYGAWTVDMVLFLIPVLGLACGALRCGVKTWLPLVLIYVAIDGLALWQKMTHSDEFQFLWIAPALLVVYLISGTALSSATSDR
jgi:hypothetical protein